MKNKYTKLVLLVLLTFNITNFQLSSAFGQVPQAINFQAIARDGSGNPMVNTNIQIRLSVVDSAQSGTIVYQELRALQTNAYGSFSFLIGVNPSFTTIGTFPAVNWGTGNKHLKIDYDPTNTFTFNLSLGTIRFVTVPYAFAAETVVFIDATGAQNGDALVYNSVTGKFEPGQVTAGTVNWTNIQNKPTFATVATSGSYGDLTNQPALNIANWNTAFGWGNHSGQYRPITWVPAWNDITTNPFAFTAPSNNQMIKYNSTTSKWENWTPNYLSTEVDGSVTNEIQTISRNGDTLNLSINGGSVIARQSQWTTSGSNIWFNSGNIGIGTTSPNASSVLEISSTTKGFLPPRMTNVQRNAITPVEGLIVYNTTTDKPNYYDGSIWRNFDGSTAVSIGDNYQGGIIAYILQPGDNGYIAEQTHGLIAAPTDQSQSTGAAWGCSGTAIGGTSTAINTGAANTNAIVAGCTEAGIAAKLCYDLVLNTYSDWYLPSKDELNLMYVNLKTQSLGSFATGNYWSSSEYSGDESYKAWKQLFDNGYQNYVSKPTTYHVRAVRAF